MGKIQKMAWQPTKVRNKKDVINEARNKGRKVHFASLMDLCHLSSRCGIRLSAGQNGRCTNIIENSQVRMCRYLGTSATTQMAKIMVQYGRSSRSSRKESGWSPSGRTIMGEGIGESSYWNTVRKKF